MTFFQRTKKLLSVLLLCTLLCSLAGCGGSPQEDTTDNSGGFKIGYASEGVTAVEDGDSLQKAYNEMVEKAKAGIIAVEMRNDAFSTDGIHFSCYIANSVQNSTDMFLAIYADAGLTDRLFLSELLRPGTAFESLTLEHALEPGTHQVYVVQTQVKDDLETIQAQTAFTMNFTVTEE